VEQINEIAFRWDKGRPSQERYEQDLRTTVRIEAAIGRRSVEEFRRSRE
jgi:hypothetical protein